ncbi:hypothetical protein KXD93_15305 [Mucilaginibacter sp. BJC16-A38]|uniref:hypothetical protein n=1 Tax=Mucilaginibacter phenanthrenivorans TaxID=1234842 RepID=UPI00215847E1|nr:hypothetical protein [Mucilaginibacter phenanthrenivorans]MCR8559023.1 hypothetical protein [Mucilaginibacter phenanthrenivorans]
MELDQFKELWAKSTTQTSAVNYNIAEMIYHDSKSPLAALEKKFKASLYIFPFVVVLFAGGFISSGVHQRPTRYLLFTILFIEFLFSLFNYLTIKKIQQPAGSIKENLIKRVFLLEKRNSTQLYVHLLLYILMAVLLEVCVHFKFDADYAGWGAINPVLRIVVYVVFLTAQFLVKRRSQKKQYGQYIDKLNSLVAQME